MDESITSEEQPNPRPERTGVRLLAFLASVSFAGRSAAAG